MFFITLLDQFYWVASAGAGAVVGSVLPFSTKGVDFVMTAMFVVIFPQPVGKEKQHYSGIIGWPCRWSAWSSLVPAASCCPPWPAFWCCCWFCASPLNGPTASSPAKRRSRRRRHNDHVPDGLTIAVCTAATMLTRFLPFLIFSSKDQQPPEVVQYLGRVLPAAIFGMLILYCLKSVTPFAGQSRHP